MHTLSSAERRALEAIDIERLVGLLSELVAFPSVANAETPAQEHMSAVLASAGMEVDRWDIDFEGLRDHEAYTADVERSAGVGVVGSFGGGAPGKTLVLNGHIDVVPAGELDRWTSPPFQLQEREGRLYGRGAVDMKGALCCAVEAVRALKQAGIDLAGTAQIQSVIGEEDGGAGTLATLLRGHTGDGAIVLEPTRGIVAPAQAGALSFRLTVRGKAAHGAFREEGVDPLEKFIPVFEALRALEASRNRDVADPLFADHDLPFALTMGRMESGIWPSTVAEDLVVEGRYGVAPGESLDEARAAFEEAVARVAEADEWLSKVAPTVEWRGAQFASARTPDGARVVEVLDGAIASVTGERAPRSGVRFGADMRLLVNQGGIPTVLYGPGDVRDAHRPDEYVLKADLIEATRVLVVTAMRFCGVSD